MYLRILKKDIKRKKTMNIILLLFVVLSAMFASSSVNNIISVVNGLDYYFEKANMSDYYYLATETNGVSSLDEIISNEPSVTDYRRENILLCSTDNLRKGNKKLVDISKTAVVMSIDNAQINYFDSNNNIIEEVEKGKIYLSGGVMLNADLEIGDKFSLKIGDTSVELEYAGFAKDAFLGSEFMNNPRFIINQSDYEKLCTDESIESYKSDIFYVNTTDVKTLEAAAADDNSIYFDGDRDTIKTTYMINMLVAGMLLIVSVCLILISFVVLRFTIGFTLSEEFREIGVMKAVGITNNSIRGLYLVKYFGISVVGAVIGYFAGIPFGNMMLESVSKTMVLGNENSVIIGALCSVAVILIIMLFCFGCTRKIKKMSPMAAVRSGQTGERFNRKSIMSLGKSKLQPTSFLAINDTLSSPKQYGIIMAVFTICILLIMILANTANTLNSDKLISFFGMTESDVYLCETTGLTETGTGAKSIHDITNEVKEKLESNDIPARVHMESFYKFPVEFNGEKMSVMFQYCEDTKASDYTYSKGTAPQYENEIAVAEPIAKKLGVDIGDTVKMTVNEKENDYIVTAVFQSMCEMGEVGRLSEKTDVSGCFISGFLAYQIDFEDNPSDEVINERIEKIRDIYDNKNVFDSEGYVKYATGASEVVSGIKNIVCILTIIIIAMITVLMERSFITKEKSEIALMKAVGFRNSSVIAQHTLRFVLVSIVSALLAAALCAPLTKLSIDPIFAIMGAVSGIKYEIKPLEIFILYPVMIIFVTIISASLTALYTRTIKASDTANIE